MTQNTDPADLATAVLLYDVAPEVEWSVLGSVVFAGVGLTYIAESRRVACVYGTLG